MSKNTYHNPYAKMSAQEIMEIFSVKRAAAFNIKKGKTNPNHKRSNKSRKERMEALRAICDTEHYTAILERNGYALTATRKQVQEFRDQQQIDLTSHHDDIAQEVSLLLWQHSGALKDQPEHTVRAYCRNWAKNAIRVLMDRRTIPQEIGENDKPAFTASRMYSDPSNLIG